MQRACSRKKEKNKNPTALGKLSVTRLKAISYTRAESDTSPQEVHVHVLGVEEEVDA